MKKITLLLLFLFSTFVNAQFFEGFENGVPGKMEQSFNKGKTTWIDFGLSAVYVDKALSETNSAVFSDGMACDEISTSLQTPILDLSQPETILEFKYLQKQRNDNYANVLFVELSNDMGKSWEEIAVYKATSNDIKIEHIDVYKFITSKQSIIRFRAMQSKLNSGYPIVIDDISITNGNKIENNKMISTAISEIKISPNPSTGLFTIMTNEPIDLTITDVNGRTIYNKEVANEIVIDLSEYAKGIYFAKIKNANRNEVKKIIIK